MQSYTPKLFFLFVVFTIFFACKPSPKTENNPIKVLEGTLGGKPATLLLQSQEQESFISFGGRLFAEGIAEQPLSVSGFIDSTGALELSFLLSLTDTLNPMMKGKLSAAGFEGVLSGVATGSGPVKLATSSKPVFNFTTRVFNDSLIIDKKKGEENPKAMISYTMWEPIGEDPAITKIFIQELFADSAAATAEAAYNNIKNNWFSGFKDQFTDDTTEYGMSYFHDQEGYLSLLHHDARYVSFASNFYEFTGGAHGNYGSGLFTYDRTNKKRLTFNDYLKTGNADQLEAILLKKFRVQNNLDPSIPLSDVLLVELEDFEATTNVAIVGKGLLFLYNPYEIASYAQGQIEIWVPFSDLKGMLKPPFDQQ